MRTGKFQKITKKKRNNSTKIVTILLALALLVCCGIGGTVAWLMDSTEAVTNTFTIGDINLTLVESPYNAANNSYGNPVQSTRENPLTNSYPLIPGNSYKKDPKVTVLANSEDCYLFVRMEKIGNPDNYLDFTFNDDGWYTYNGEEGVYYREVSKSASDQSWDLLKKIDGDFTIKVSDKIVKAGTASGDYIDMPANNPEIKFTAYAVQKANLSLEKAWELVDPTT